MSEAYSVTDLDYESDEYSDENYDDEKDLHIEFNMRQTVDPEYFDYECLSTEDVEILLNEGVEAVCASLQVSPSVAKVLLHTYNWKTNDIILKYKEDDVRFLADSKVKPVCSPESNMQVIRNRKSITCPICLQSHQGEDFEAMACGHYFCKECWTTYFEIQIFQGLTTGIECMGQSCNLLVPEDFVLSVLDKSLLREKFQQFAFSDYVKSHPQLRYCPGPNCNFVVYAKESQSKRVVCKHCKTMFCFKCGADYHAPADCNTMRKWITKCTDDSETANYISAHTKDCPNCLVCIEKNGGCNHVQCSKCKFHFCWICVGDWKLHGTNYYECSQFKDNPDIVNESAHAQAREALKKYLFYFDRWENHSKSLKLEEQTFQKIKDIINSKLMANEGGWIDWQYLKDAAEQLAKCRYTLQYTYPFAYYMESSPRKALFEYQQAQLEAEIENLSWKIERAEKSDRADIVNQMHVAEKRRLILLRDFLSV